MEKIESPLETESELELEEAGSQEGSDDAKNADEAEEQASDPVKAAQKASLLQTFTFFRSPEFQNEVEELKEQESDEPGIPPTIFKDNISSLESEQDVIKAWDAY